MACRTNLQKSGAGRALLKDPYLAKFVSTKEIIIADVDYKYFHKLSNVNKLLGEIIGIGGLKTGYTELAGQNSITINLWEPGLFFLKNLSQDRLYPRKYWSMFPVIFTSILTPVVLFRKLTKLNGIHILHFLNMQNQEEDLYVTQLLYIMVP